MIEFFRQFRFSGYAIFDFVVSFLGIYFFISIIIKDIFKTQALCSKEKLVVFNFTNEYSCSCSGWRDDSYD